MQAIMTWLDNVTRADVAQLMMLTDRVLARVGAWKRAAAHEEDLRHVVARDINIQNFSGACRRMKGLMKTIFSQKGKSERLLSNGAICGLIGEVEVVVATRQWSLMY